MANHPLHVRLRKSHARRVLRADVSATLDTRATRVRAASSRSEWAPDGYLDLLCQFLDDPALWVPEEDSATTNATLEYGTRITGPDPICTEQ